jgi:hypothetical protein
MGFNHRKMKAERKAKADAEAAAGRATDAQVLQDAERLISLGRAPSQANSLAVRADDRRRAHQPAPFPHGSIPACRQPTPRHRGHTPERGVTCRSCRILVALFVDRTSDISLTDWYLMIFFGP